MKTLQKSLAICALVLVGPLLPTPAGAQDLDLSGEWLLTVESPNGTGTRQVTFVQKGDDLTGTIASSRASGDLTGSVEGENVRFVAVVNMESGPFEIAYTATVVDGLMEGTVDFGDYGSGTFAGRRVESEALR